MTILHIITRLIVGGAQQNTILSCAGQVAAGHRVVLAYGPIYGPEGSLLEEARRSGAELVEVPALRRAVLPGHDLLAYRALRRLIRQVQPDIVHTHSSKAGIVGRAAAWSERAPGVIHTIHGLPFYDRQNPLVHQAYILAERWAARRCHKLIGITQAMCDAFAQNRIGRPEQFAVVPSGIDLSLFESCTITREQVRSELGLPADADAPVVGILARLDALKGQDDLLDALPRLLERYPKLHVLFIGEGWHGQELRQRVAQQGWQSRVIFSGLVQPTRVAQLLRAADVIALPSYQEGQGRALVEALASGCAIVGYDVGGIGAVCIDGQTGKLAPIGDRQALANAILWLLDHPQERRRMIARGRELIHERFDAKGMVRDLQRIYEQVLGERISRR